MGRKRDYTDFIKFAKQHKNLSRTNIINEFRKQGGKVQKQKGLEILREVFNISKGERKTKNVSHNTSINNNKNYVRIMKHKNDMAHRSLKSEGVYNLYDKIKKMFNTSNDKYIVVDIKAKYDEWSYNNTFSVFIPFNGRIKQGSKALSDKIYSNLKTFYSNLSKMYDSTKVSGIMLEQLKKIKTKINKLKYPSFEEIKSVYSFFEIEINDIYVIHFKE